MTSKSTSQRQQDKRLVQLLFLENEFALTRSSERIVLSKRDDTFPSADALAIISLFRNH
ncbi:hypothetical protein [Neorhizobium alkalisoli]|uniref:hypothetical protein n=1 Tax=Neorhizobium alkalisoli TaxID=528178 RepID=UPI00164760E9|nr:hypothetical protein [Neorhizobium alkalisoli]